MDSITVYIVIRSILLILSDNKFHKLKISLFQRKLQYFTLLPILYILRGGERKEGKG